MRRLSPRAAIRLPPRCGSPRRHTRARAGSRALAWLRRLVPVVVTALLAPAAAAGIRLKDDPRGLDLLLVGYAVLHTNLAEDLGSFFDAADGFPDDFTNRQVLNLRLDGKLTKGTSLDAWVFHDRENLRDWRYHVGLHGARSGFAIGELEGAFGETYFTRYNTPFYGAQGALGLGAFTVSGFTTTRSAAYRVDRLRGNNLSGPYILSASPLLEASDRVAIEVRDRRDEERLISSDSKVRGVDYTIDYGTGTVLFREPIEAETFDGDPVYVVVEYQRVPLDGEGEAEAYLFGSRVAVTPREGIDIGTTYLRSNGGTDSPLDRGILGFDPKIRLGRWLDFEGEAAGPGGDFTDRHEGAMRFGLGLKPLESLEVRGRYQRVGPDYEVTANPQLDAELDREQWEIDASFVPAEGQRFAGGYGERIDDVAKDPDRDRTRVKTLFAGWEGRMGAAPLLRLRLERRVTEGAASLGGGGSEVDTVTLDAEDDFAGVPLLGATAIKGQYRFEDTVEGLDGAATRHTHGVRARVNFRPVRWAEPYLEWRGTWTHGENTAPLDSRTREILGGLSLDLPAGLTGAGSVRRRTSQDDASAENWTTRTSALVDLSYEPSARLRGMLRYEWTLTGAGIGDGARTRNVLAQAGFVPFEGVTATVGYRLDDRGEEGGDQGGLDGEWYLSLLYERADRLTLYFRAERGRSEERLPPFEPTVSAREIWLTGLSYDLDDRWSVLGQLKEETLEDATKGFRRAVVGELSRSLAAALRIAVGVEVTLQDEGEELSDASRLYLKLIGRL